MIGTKYVIYTLFYCNKTYTLLRASTVGLPYAKCKVYLAYKPKKCLAIGRLNLGKAKFF